jgi:hypothetical protein
MGIVGLVAMHVHQAAGALGQVHQKNDGADALFTGIFEMRDAPDHIGPHGDGALHQFTAVWIGLDTFLGKRDDLQIDQMASLFAHFEHRLECPKRRIGHIDVGTDMLDTVLGQHADGGMRALLGVLMGNARLALTPAFDTFEQRAAHVPLRIASGERGIQMNVRLDQRGNQQLPLRIDIVGLCHDPTCLCVYRCNGGAIAGNGVQSL